MVVAVSVDQNLNKKFKIVFAGTPSFAVPSLEKLANDNRFSIELVITQPDRPAGRGLELNESAVKKAAKNHNFKIAQPNKIKEIFEDLKTIAPDVIAVVAYGEFIPKSILELPTFGCMNVHPSLLPKYRGAAPVNHALLNGEKTTGVSIMFLNERMDAGDILHQETFAIEEDFDAPFLLDRLSKNGAEALCEEIYKVCTGTAVRTKQDEDKVCFAPLIKKEDGAIDWNKTSEQIFNMFRAYKPWPGVNTHFAGKKAKILDCNYVHANEKEIFQFLNGKTIQKGEFVLYQDILLIGANNGSLLKVKTLQLEGKKPISAKDFVNGLAKNIERKFL